MEATAQKRLDAQIAPCCDDDRDDNYHDDGGFHLNVEVDDIVDYDFGWVSTKDKVILILHNLSICPKLKMAFNKTTGRQFVNVI